MTNNKIFFLQILLCIFAFDCFSQTFTSPLTEAERTFVLTQETDKNKQQNLKDKNQKTKID